MKTVNSFNRNVKNQLLAAFFSTALLLSCSDSKKKADLIVYNAVVYTLDSSFHTAEAFAVKDGKILAVGKSDSILNFFEGEKLDAAGKAVYPGFIDAHCHFYGYGKGLTEADLVGTASYEDVLQKVKDYAPQAPGEWIIGRGWDQNDWPVKEFPTKEKLDSLFPDRPVFLKRVDGHAALVNSEALRRAGITNDTKVEGGEIILYKKGISAIGELKTTDNVSGVLVDNAIDLVSKKIPYPTDKEIAAALLRAQENCFAAGLTTVDDAGLDKKVVETIQAMHASGELKMRIYAMLSDNRENLEYFTKNGVIKTPRLNVCSFKFYADGALGSRGACLLEPYADQPEKQGFLLSPPEYFENMIRRIAGFQLNTHCIGDSSNRLLLNYYSRYFEQNNPGKLSPRQLLDKYRWRIEHAQVVSLQDTALFRYVIPSIQPTHATSDMYWAGERLGHERVKGAYAYKYLLNMSGMVALGTDFPVENINPMYTFFAATARQDLKGYPEGGYQMEHALTREETLKGMTIWAAYSNFEEKEKGSIEPGKYADFIILDKDIMTIPLTEVPGNKVIYTFVNGEKVFQLK